MGNWDCAVVRKEKALKHTSRMKEVYYDDTKKSIINTKFFPADLRTDVNIDRDKEGKVTVESMGSAEAVFTYADNGKVCVLNFASYRYAGGQFINGAMAQEEALCHSSNLYNILSSNRINENFYTKNKLTLNNNIYESNMLYVPDVVFDDESGTVVKCDVITCAAPNKGAVLAYHKECADKVDDAMYERIDHILFVAKTCKVDTLILGAFGCGVFKNDSLTVAKFFKELLDEKYKNCFNKVIFAIPGGENYKNFKGVLL